MNKTFILLTLFTCIIFSGCAVAQQEMGNTLGEDQYPLLGHRSTTLKYVGEPDYFLSTEDAKFLSQDIRDCVRDRTVLNKICVGMPVPAVASVFGLPDKIQKSGGAYGSRSMWIYRKPYTKTLYLFFEESKLKSWNY